MDSFKIQCKQLPTEKKDLTPHTAATQVCVIHLGGQAVHQGCTIELIKNVFPHELKLHREGSWRAA